MRLCEAEYRTEAWRGYVADSLWMIATHRSGMKSDRSPAYLAYTEIMQKIDAGKPVQADADPRTAEQVKNDLLAKLDKLAGDK